MRGSHPSLTVPFLRFPAPHWKRSCLCCSRCVPLIVLLTAYPVLESSSVYPKPRGLSLYLFLHLYSILLTFADCRLSCVTLVLLPTPFPAIVLQVGTDCSTCHAIPLESTAICRLANPNMATPRTASSSNVQKGAQSPLASSKTRHPAFFPLWTPTSIRETPSADIFSGRSEASAGWS